MWDKFATAGDSNMSSWMTPKKKGKKETDRGSECTTENVSFWGCTNTIEQISHNFLRKENAVWWGNNAPSLPQQCSPAEQTIEENSMKLDASLLCNAMMSHAASYKAFIYYPSSWVTKVWNKSASLKNNERESGRGIEPY